MRVEEIRERIGNPPMIIYAQDLERMIKFYHQLFGFTLREAHYAVCTSNYARLQRDETELILVEAEVLNIGESKDMLKREEIFSHKPVFVIEESITDCRRRTIVYGGSFPPKEEVWEEHGYQVCEGTDIEGNVFQVCTERKLKI